MDNLDKCISSLRQTISKSIKLSCDQTCLYLNHLEQLNDVVQTKNDSIVARTPYKVDPKSTDYADIQVVVSNKDDTDTRITNRQSNDIGTDELVVVDNKANEDHHLVQVSPVADTCNITQDHVPLKRTRRTSRAKAKAVKKATSTSTNVSLSDTSLGSTRTRKRKPATTRTDHKKKIAPLDSYNVKDDYTCSTVLDENDIIMNLDFDNFFDKNNITI